MKLDQCERERERGAAVPTYVTLINWTDQGIRNFKDSTSRAKEAEELMGKLGVRLKSVLWTVGPYDIVTIVEADDEESATAALLALGSQGNVRTTTMRAYDAEEMSRIVGKLPG
jgi:uncharacterized protein with GYD domain